MSREMKSVTVIAGFDQYESFNEKIVAKSPNINSNAFYASDLFNYAAMVTWVETDKDCIKCLNKSLFVNSH